MHINNSEEVWISTIPATHLDTFIQNLVKIGSLQSCFITNSGLPARDSWKARWIFDQKLSRKNDEVNDCSLIYRRCSIVSGLQMKDIRKLIVINLYEMLGNPLGRLISNEQTPLQCIWLVQISVKNHRAWP